MAIGTAETTAAIIFSGITNNFFEDGFNDSDITSLSSTQLIVTDATSGFVTTINGFGFVDNGPTLPPGGTITSMTIRDNLGNDVLAISGIAWTVFEFALALDDTLENDGNGGLLEALLSRQAVVVDASGADIGADFRFDNVTSPVTITGSANADTLGGGQGNDSINPGTVGAFDGDLVYGSLGNDTINLVDLPSNSFFMLTYEEITGGVTFNLDGDADTFSVVKPGGATDTILNVGNALSSDGLDLWGTAQDDVFNIDPGAGGGFIQLRGMGGNDTFNLTLDGTVRLSYNGGWTTGPSTGIIADLSTGTVSQDGFNGTDTIITTAGSGRLELRGTDFNDSIIGSDADERFILEQGFDTLDGGLGFDTLRYDRSGVDAINVDLPNGQVTGTWDGNFFQHSVSNVEQFRGSRLGNDTMIGDAGDNEFQGRGGNDSLVGNDGNDNLDGDDGNDTLLGGNGEDYLWGGYGDDFLDAGNSSTFAVADGHAGNDTVDAASMRDGTLLIEHYNLVNSGFAQTVTVTNATSTVDKGGSNGTTTVINGLNAMEAQGLRFRTSSSDDVFNINLTTGAEDALVHVVGGRGNDTYNLSGGFGQVLFAFTSDNTYNPATQGVVVNLATGVVSNDGFGGTDTINGVGNMEVGIQGSALADTLTGSDQDDFFLLGEGGNDVVDGGAGDEDVVLYLFSDVAVDVDLSAGTATGAGFVQTLSNIEGVEGSNYNDTLAGGDGASELEGGAGDDFLYGDGLQVGLVAEEAGQVWRMYQGALGRTPDTGGHEGWTERLVEGERTLEGMGDAFVTSAEFQARFGGGTTTDFVTRMYNNVLGRDPDAVGLAGWTDRIDNQGWTEGRVVAVFSNSGENRTRTADDVTEFLEARTDAVWSDDVFRVYQATLGRTPDFGGFMGWTERLGDGRDIIDTVTGFVNSAEFQTRYASATTTTEFITQIYNNVLGRGPDPVGLAGWTDRLDNQGWTQAEVVLGIAQSAEFITRSATDLVNWMRGLGTDDVLNGGAGTNVLVGGILSDEFVFEAAQMGTNRVADLELWDTLVFDGFGYGLAADARAHMTQSGDDVVFADQGTTITINNVVLADISDDMLAII